MSYKQSSKQDTLVSGTNIKTINSQSLLGSGNISISGATLADGDYGDITVGSGGTTMTIDNGAVTNTKINDVDGSKVTQSASYRLVTDTEKSTWNGKLDANTPITGATKTKITYDADGLVTSGADATTADIADSTNKRYVTDAQLTVIGNTSGTNTGDETQSTIKTKLGAASSGVDGYLTGTDWTTFNGKQNAITNGFGITGTTTKAVALTSSAAFCTAETTISAVTYADITGASITLAAGTWLIMATVNGASQTTTVAVMMAAITDGANTVIAEASQHIPAGTATVRTWGNLSLSAVVTPAGSTTYKLRGARGTTTQTGNWIASDGNGVNTANNVSNNSDKGTVIMAVRIA